MSVAADQIVDRTRGGRPPENLLTHVHPEHGPVRMVSSDDEGAVIADGVGDHRVSWQGMERVLKRCQGCGELVELACFHRSTRTRDRRINQCRECRNAVKRDTPPEKSAEYNRRYKERNPEKIRESNRRDRERHPERHRAAEKASRQRHIEKHRARSILKNAVFNGRIEKPDTCEDCGQQFEKRQIHGHHEDYGKPLDVRWLCHQCHLAAHGGEFAHPSWCRGNCPICWARDDEETRQIIAQWPNPEPEPELRLWPCFECGQPTRNSGRCAECQARIEGRRPHP